MNALERVVRPTGFPLDPNAAHGTLAYLSSERGERAAALAHVQETLRSARLMATDFAAWMAHLIEAHVLLACGREDEGLGALRRALQLGRAAGLYGITREEVDIGAGHERLRRRLARELLRLARYWDTSGERAQARRAFERVLVLHADSQEARAAVMRLTDQSG